METWTKTCGVPLPFLFLTHSPLHPFGFRPIRPIRPGTEATSSPPAWPSAPSAGPWRPSPTWRPRSLCIPWTNGSCATRPGDGKKPEQGRRRRPRMRPFLFWGLEKRGGKHGTQVRFGLDRPHGFGHGKVGGCQLMRVVCRWWVATTWLLKIPIEYATPKVLGQTEAQSRIS